MRAKALVVLGLLVALVGLLTCGGGGGGNGPSAPPAPAVPSITVSPGSISFGNQLVNTRSNSGVVTVTNTGSANLVLSAAAVTGTNASDFSFSPSTFPRTVTPGANTTFTIVFTPASPGPRSATFTLTDNAGGSPHSLALSGTGLAPAIGISPGQITFAAQLVKTTSSPTQIVISNSGTGSLVISGMGFAGANATDFTVLAATPITIAPGTSTKLPIRFTPTASGLRSATLTLTDNASGSPHSLGVSGIGIDQGPAQDSRGWVSINPTTAPIAVTTDITITGTLTSFASGATVANFGPGTTVGDGTATGVMGGYGPIVVTSPTSATAKVTIDPTAAPGPRYISVMTGDHVSTATFNIPAHDGPVSNAGQSQTTQVGRTVHLDAGNSTNASAPQPVARVAGAGGSPTDPLSFQWTIVSAPNGSTSALADATSAQPSFLVDKAGTYVAQLGVSDGTNTRLSSVIVSTLNAPPVAHAGATQFVKVGTSVRLNGSGSTDTDGDTLTYAWTILSKPAGSAAALSNAAAITPKFTADVDGDYIVALTVNDNHGNTSTDSVKISTTQTAPIADAGPNQKAAPGTVVQLNGSNSSDPDGNVLNFAWSFLTKPAGSNAALSDVSASNPSFTADLPGTYILQLVLNDGHGNSSVDSVLISTSDPGPKADAGAAQEVTTGSTVQLDASKSSDPDNDPLTYSWAFLSKPAGSTAAFSDPTSVNPAFVADQPGQYVAQVIVSDSIFVSVPATVLITVGTPVFSAAPTSVNFGNQTVGITSSSLPITITNTGSGTLRLNNITIQQAAQNEFAFTSALLPTSLGAGESTTVNVTLTPGTAGLRSASLIITDNAAGSPHTIALSGTGNTPTIGVNPLSLGFNNIMVGTSSAPTPVTISNTGLGTLAISNITITGASAGDFNFTAQPLPLNVGPNTSTTVNVTFAPTQTGSRTATLNISDNATGSPHTISLSGTGTFPGISANPTSLDFGNQLVGTPSNSKLITITNTGTANLVVSNVALTGGNSGDFAASTQSPLPVTVFPNASTTITVTFTPSAAGARSSTLAITHNAGGSSLNIPVAGTGTAPIFQASPTSITFADQLKNTTSSPSSVSIQNTGTANLVISNITITGINAGDFALQPITLPVTIAPGNSAPVGVTFTPSSGGPRSATLNLTDNASGSPHSIGLSGNGTGPGINVSPTSVVFTNQQLNQASAPSPVTITNTGTANLVISSLSITGVNSAEFNASSTTLPITVAPGTNTVVNVTFTPTALGSRSATLTI